MSSPVAEWPEVVHGELASDRVLGWIALYWDGAGGLNNADIYSSVVLPWNFVVHEPDPENLPLVNLQVYLLFYRRHGQIYTVWLDGDDEFWLWGKSQVVTGLLLPDNKWNQIQKRAKEDIWLHRGQFKDGRWFKDGIPD